LPLKVIGNAKVASYLYEEGKDKKREIRHTKDLKTIIKGRSRLNKTACLYVTIHTVRVDQTINTRKNMDTGVLV